jgi:hypothetical protein
MTDSGTDPDEDILNKMYQEVEKKVKENFELQHQM